eukprot:m.101614 g.101614  ORF g.101614 m.101614 type:complete len:101 (-) comp20767_c0_seq1:1248-1550(-)
MSPKGGFRAVWQSKFVQYGVPMILLMVGASFGLREVAAFRIESREERSRKLSVEEIDRMTNTPRKKFSMGDEFERLKADVDIDTWENKRVPRPGESTRDL